MAVVVISIILVTLSAWTVTAQRPADEFCRACGMGTNLDKCSDAYDVPANLTIDRSLCNQISTQPKEVKILCGRYAKGYYLKCFKGTSMFTCQASCGSDVESIGKNLENVNKLMNSGLLASLNPNNQQQGSRGGQAGGNNLFSNFPNFGNVPTFGLNQQPDFFNNVFNGFQQPPRQFPTQPIPVGNTQPAQGGTQGGNTAGQSAFPATPVPTPLPTPPPTPVPTPPQVNYPTPPPLGQTQPQVAQGGAVPGDIPRLSQNVGDTTGLQFDPASLQNIQAGQGTQTGAAGQNTPASIASGQGSSPTPTTGLTAGGTAGFAGGPRGQFFQNLPQLGGQNNFFNNIPVFGNQQPPGGFNFFGQPNGGSFRPFSANPATVPGQTASGQGVSGQQGLGQGSTGTSGQTGQSGQPGVSSPSDTVLSPVTAPPPAAGQSGAQGGGVTSQQGGGAAPTGAAGQQNLGFAPAGIPQFGNQQPFGRNQLFGFGGAQGNQPQQSQPQTFGYPTFAGQPQPAAANGSQGQGFQLPNLGGNAQQQGGNLPQPSQNPNQNRGFFSNFGPAGQQGNFFNFPSQRPPSQQATFTAPYFGGNSQQGQPPPSNTQSQGPTPTSPQRPGGFGFQPFPQNNFFSQPMFGGQQGFGGAFPGFPSQGGFGPSAAAAGGVPTAAPPGPVAVSGADVSGPLPTVPGPASSGAAAQGSSGGTSGQPAAVPGLPQPNAGGALGGFGQSGPGAGGLPPPSVNAGGFSPPSAGGAGRGGFPVPGVAGNQNFQLTPGAGGFSQPGAPGGGFPLPNTGDNTQLPGGFGIPQTAPAVAAGGSGTSGVASSSNPTVTVASPPEPPSPPSTDSPVVPALPSATEGEDRGASTNNAAEEPQVPPEVLSTGASGFPADGLGDASDAEGGFGDSDQNAGQGTNQGSNQQPVDPRFGNSLNDLRSDLDKERNFFNPSQGSAFPALGGGSQSRPGGFLSVPSFANNYNRFRDFDPFRSFSSGNLQNGATGNQGSAFPGSSRGSNFGNTAAKDSPVERTNAASQSDFGDFGSFDSNFGDVDFGSLQASQGDKAAKPDTTSNSFRNMHLFDMINNKYFGGDGKTDFYG